MAEPPPVRSVIDRAAAKYQRARERELTDHPSPAALVEYQEGRLEGPPAEAIRAHLVVCRRCSEEVLRLDDFDSEPAADPVEEPAVAAARGWELFKGRAELDEPLAHTATPLASPRRLWNPGWSALAVAAAMTFAVIGVGFFLAAARRSSQPAAAAGGQPLVFDLLPDGTRARRDMAGLEEISVPPGMDPIVPRLLLGDQTPYTSYSASLVGASGVTAWRQTVLRRQPAGELALMIPRGALRPGDYVIHVEGTGAGTSRPLATYSLRIKLEN